MVSLLWDPAYQEARSEAEVQNFGSGESTQGVHKEPTPNMPIGRSNVMRATTGAGKGGLPREGQYSKKNRALYAKGYDSAFGVRCAACNGRGYSWSVGGASTSPVKKITCSNCNGTGHFERLTT